jgi:hypothetical protein
MGFVCCSAGLSALKMETVCLTKMLVSTYKSTWHHNLGEQCRHLHHSENPKSHRLAVINDVDSTK